MPTRKQRRRQAKSKRHDYEYVYVDDEGNEVEVEDEPQATREPRAKPSTNGKPAKTPATVKDARGRTLRPAKGTTAASGPRPSALRSRLLLLARLPASVGEAIDRERERDEERRVDHGE